MIDGKLNQIKLNHKMEKSEIINTVEYLERKG